MNKMTAMKRNMRRERIIKKAIAMLAYMILFVVIGLLVVENRGLKQEIAELTIEHEQVLAEVSENYETIIDTKNSEICEKNQTIISLGRTIDHLGEVINDVDDQITEVANINKEYVDELTMLRNRSELYDKYEYAIIDNGERTELTYAEIELGEQLMHEKGIDPNLMFGTIMVESRANPKAVNASSGATGYGQFLNSTARWVWTDLMGNKNYYSDLRKNGEVNIQMMAEYYDYLYSVNNNTFKVVKCYSGNKTDEGASEYLAKVNNFTRKVGVTLN